MTSDFKVLSLKEEAMLSESELDKYYSDFRKYVSERKLTNTTFGATTIGPKLKNITTKIAVAVTKLFSNKNVEWVCDGTENIPKETAIFAHTHQGILDTFVWIPNLKRHCLILINSKVNKLLLLCQCNTGLVLVTRDNKESMMKAKLDMIQLLMSGHSLTFFPEGVWNLSPNKLHLPMRYGFLDIARKANVPVVPVIHEYTHDTSIEKGKIKKIHTKYGKPIYISPSDDINRKLEEYKAQVSTIRYELIEEKGLYHRTEIDNYDYINYLKASHKHLKMGNIVLEEERHLVFGSEDDLYCFLHINDIPFNDNGELLDTEETIRLNKIIDRELSGFK